MALASKYLQLILISFILLWFMVQSSQGGKTIQTRVFQSPKIEVEPGQASNKYFFNMNFPKGHIAFKSFDAEIVDDKGKVVPLYNAYLHHWIVIRYHQDIKNQSNFNPVPVSGVCNPDSGLILNFGVGAETRRTFNRIPDPYGIEVGNSVNVPQGFQERWLLNVHVIDTHNTVDSRGCLECTCDLYSNITMPEPLPRDYYGGLRCCTDGARCRVKEGYSNGKISLYMKVHDKANESTGIKAQHNCQIEYDVEACPGGNRGCIDSRTFKFEFERGGNVIYGVGHLHIGGTAIALSRDGGRDICTSYTKYGTGREPGNEAGCVMGMSTCHPRPGSIKISPREKLTLVSNYSSSVRHTGVMGLFYLLVAD